MLNVLTTLLLRAEVVVFNRGIHHHHMAYNQSINSRNMILRGVDCDSVALGANSAESFSALSFASASLRHHHYVVITTIIQRLVYHESDYVPGRDWVSRTCFAD